VSQRFTLADGRISTGGSAAGGGGGGSGKLCAQQVSLGRNSGALTLAACKPG